MGDLRTWPAAWGAVAVVPDADLAVGAGDGGGTATEFDERALPEPAGSEAAGAAVFGTAAPCALVAGGAVTELGTDALTAVEDGKAGRGGFAGLGGGVTTVMGTAAETTAAPLMSAATT